MKRPKKRYFPHPESLKTKWGENPILRRPLTQKERDVYHLRSQGLTLAAIGRFYGLTRERIRQILLAANLKLDYQRRKNGEKKEG